MKHLARRKIVFVIVEGPSDETALGITLSQYFDNDAVYVHIMHGDITTRKGVNPQNIVSKIGNEIKAYAKSHHYKSVNFMQIIHIVDTDGAYIPKENILEDIESHELLYQDDGIHTNNKDKVVIRNKIKAENLYRLRSCGSIWNIPYRVYYMSCNLDHVLYGKRNSSDDEKENDAYNFAKMYRNENELFLKYICESEFSVKGDFKKSWEFIEEDMNSIERYTNLSVCFDEENKKRKLHIHEVL